MEKRAIDMVSKNVQNALKCKGLTLSYNRSGKSKKVKYKRPTKAAPKPKALPFFRGYDLLENMMVVRQYIQKKNNIDIGLLEILLYLAPKQYFTQADYKEMPKQFTYCYMSNLVKTGYIVPVQAGTSNGKKIFTVNRKGQEIVRNFYELLSGEKLISEVLYQPLTKKKGQTTIDKKRMDLITKINRLPVSESKKALFQ